MKKEDRDLKKFLQSQQIEMEEDTRQSIDALLMSLPEKTISTEKQKSTAIRWKVVFATVAAIFILPNINPTVAKAMYEIPVIGELFRVVTIREYHYQDEGHEAEIEVPEIIVDNSSGAAEINEKTQELVNYVISEFENSLEEGKYQATYVDYEVICDSENWFTLKLQVSEVIASSNQYYQYYHIDKATGEMVKLSDLFENDSYIDAISENIRQQMEKEMENAEDDSVDYWIKSANKNVDECYKIEKDQNFYFNEAGEIVIVYDKYVVGPGSMGCPEFAIPQEVYMKYVKGTSWKN